MTYLIDAWLERPHPYLRIVNRETGEVCAELAEDALEELREQGDLDLPSLGSSEPQVLKELVRSLFLFCYARALRPHTSGAPAVQMDSQTPASAA
jgi:hypothetical protein